MKNLHWLKPKYLFGLSIILTAICLIALRANNEHMIKLRSAVYASDKSDSNVILALQNLQAYVTTHMNTNLSIGNDSVYPPIQLKYTYERLLNAESANAAANNSQLYTNAQEYCQQQIPTGFSGRYRVPCIEQYVQSHDTNLPAVPDALYKFDFVSPSWSPDSAGYSLVLAVLGWMIAIFSLILTKFWRRKR